MITCETTFDQQTVPDQQTAPDQPTTLDQLRPGQCGRIVRIDGVDGIASRLREMGFIPGQTVQYLRRAAIG